MSNFRELSEAEDHGKYYSLLGCSYFTHCRGHQRQESSHSGADHTGAADSWLRGDAETLPGFKLSYLVKTSFQWEVLSLWTPNHFPKIHSIAPLTMSGGIQWLSLFLSTIFTEHLLTVRK